MTFLDGVVLGAVAWLGMQPVVAQSSFIFSNYLPPAGLDAPVLDANGDRLFGSDYVTLLYGGPASDSLSPAWDEVLLHVMDPVPLTAMGDGGGGYFQKLGFVQIGTVPCGGVAWLEVRAWDTRLGETYEEVEALGIGGYGESNLFQKRGGVNCGLPSPPEPLLGLESFSLRPVVPEPSAWLLLLLGLPILWRRISKPH